LYWHFVDQHRESFAENGRVSLMVSTYGKKPDSEKQLIRDSALKFMATL